MVDESESKRQKHKVDEEIADRFSTLPDALLTHILSFLPIQEAVRTCILSKRLRFSWTFLSKLEFIDNIIVPSSIRKRRKQGKWFDNFVDGVLGFRGFASIKDFTLHYSLNYWPARICLWISTAVMCNVEELILRVDGLKSITLPESLYTCQKLRVLKLRGPFTLEVPDSVCLTSLKTLDLEEIRYDDSLNKLLTSCALEDLVIKRHYYNRGWMSCICSPSLKYLTIRDCRSSGCSVVVDTPNLKNINLYLNDGTTKSYILRTPSLYMADITISDALNADVYNKLLRSISNVEELKILINQDIPDDHYQKLSVFYNLKRLDVKLEQDKWNHVLYLLDQSPNLESLVLEFEHFHRGWHQTDYNAGCLCVFPHLQEVTIKGFVGWDTEMQAIQYFLKNATVLKQITLYFDTEKWWYAKHITRTKKDILKELLTFPCVSSTCQLRIQDKELLQPMQPIPRAIGRVY